VHFDRYGYGLLMKNFSLGLYICFLIQATFVTFEENFEFELKFSNLKNVEKFFKKVPNFIKNALFLIQIVFSIFVYINEKHYSKWPL
jgi:hypothetical protein